MLPIFFDEKEKAGLSNEINNSEMENKIDLSEISELAAVIPFVNSQENDGVCLSFQDCALIGKALEALPKMHEALTEISKGFGDGLETVWLEKLESGIEKANEILQQFEQ